jgi:hypothetical protein
LTIEELCRLNKQYASTPEGSINTRCPFCGDSQKPGHRTNYGQAYIFPDGFAKCFKCGKYSTAIEMIEEIFGTLNIPIDQELLTKFKTKEIHYIYSKSDVKYIKINQSEFDFFKDKVKFIEMRLGKSVTIDDLNNMKFVLDFNNYADILKSRGKGYIQFDEYIGYLTFNNKKLILRSINSNAKRPHIKIELTDSRFTFDFWSNQDLIDSIIKHKALILGEGIFDVSNHKIIETFGDKPIAAAMSKWNLINTIKSIYTESLIKFDLIFLRDIDIDINFLRFMIKQVKPYISSVHIYSNLNGKDFGDYQDLIPNLEYDKNF